MTRLINEITINAPVEKIWQILSTVRELEKFDPTVEKSTQTSPIASGLGASRKVDMKDGKNWFEEKTTAYTPNEALAFDLTDCSFPINKLKHSYSFLTIGSQTKVTQVMEYHVKFGLLGKLSDSVMIRKQTDNGIKKFFGGLSAYVEKMR